VKQITTILLAGVASMFLSACGGGSNDSASETPLELVTITEQNADAVMASAFQSISGAMDIQDIPLLSTTSSVAKSTSIMKKYAKTVSTDLQISKIVTGSEACSGGGTVSYGADDVTGEGTITFNECVETDTIITGTIILDGTAKTTIDGLNYTVEFIGFKIQIDHIVAFYEHVIATLNESNGDFSATITGYSTDGVDRIDLKNYTVTIIGDNLTLNGLVKTNCMGAWIEVKTSQALIMPGSCPVSGEISILGNNIDIKIVFNSDESVSVFLDGQTYASYNTCDELPSINEVCP